MVCVCVFVCVLFFNKQASHCSQPLIYPRIFIPEALYSYMSLASPCARPRHWALCENTNYSTRQTVQKKLSPYLTRYE